MRKDTPIRRRMSVAAARMRVPITGCFELTPRCNLGCKMCYIRMSTQQMLDAGGERTGSEWISMGRQAAKAGTVFLLLTGGEPFLRPDFREIYTNLSAMGFSISINTNGTKIDDETLSWLTELPPAQVNITLYGTGRETYGRLCGMAEGYDRAVYAIDGLTKAGILVGLNATLTPYNAEDLPKIAEFAKSRGLCLRTTAYLFPPDRKQAGTRTNPARFEAEAAGRASALGQWLSEDQDRLRRYVSMEDGEQELELLDTCVRSEAAPLRCFAGASQFWITWNGLMTPCGMMTEPQARPFEVGFDEAWRQTTKNAAAITMPAQCDQCKLRLFCPTCAAVNQSETGRFDQRPDYLCRMTQEYRRELKRLAESVETVKKGGCLF